METTQLTFGEVSYIIDTLKTYHDSISVIVGAGKEDSNRFLKYFGEILGQDVPDNIDDESEMNALAQTYGKVKEIIDKLSKIREDSCWQLSHVLFPYSNLHGNELQASEREEIDAKKKFIVEFLTSGRDKERTYSCDIGNKFFYGMKHKKSNRILIWECDNYIRHEFHV